MATRKLEVVITGDASQLDRALGKAGNSSRSFAKTIGKAGLAGAVVGLGAAVKVGVGEFMEAQKVTAQTNAVLKSTGGVANVSAAQVGKLSESLMKKSGVDDEAIQSGQNMLLTFTKIRNETGKGNKVFDQATKATLNLSVAMGKDMQSSAILVGKALNDPVKGATALSRAGVQLTQDQKDMIKQLVEGSSAAYALSTTLSEKLTPAQYKQALQMEKAGMSVKAIADKLNLDYTPAQIAAAQEATKGGKTIEAQKILLKELETQFGGSAEAAGKTFGGQINIAKQQLSNLAGEIVAKVVPVLVSMVGWIDRNRSAVAAIAVAVGSLTGLIVTYRIATAAATAVTTAATLAKGLFTTSTVAATTATGAQTVAQTGLNTAMRLNPIGLVVTALAALAAGVVIAYQKSETFRNIVDTLWERLRGVGTWMRETFPKAKEAFLLALAPVIAQFNLWWSVIAQIIDGVKWLIDNIGKISGNMVDAARSRARDEFGPGGKGDADLKGALSAMQPFANSAAAYGLQVTSGLRPGARTRHGTLSDHAVGKALDLSNTYKGDPDGTPQMASFFKSLVGNASVKQAFYDPLGSIFGGKLSGYREGGHSDHVHVATYDQGGVLRPGWTMAYNGTGRNEYVTKDGGGDIVIQIGAETLARINRQEAEKHARRNAI